MLQWWKQWQEWMNAPWMGASVSFWLATILSGLFVLRFVFG